MSESKNVYKFDNGTITKYNYNFLERLGLSFDGNLYLKSFCSKCSDNILKDKKEIRVYSKDLAEEDFSPFSKKVYYVSLIVCKSCLEVLHKSKEDFESLKKFMRKIAIVLQDTLDKSDGL